MKMFYFDNRKYGECYTVMAPNVKAAVKYVQNRIKALHSAYRCEFKFGKGSIARYDMMTAKLSMKEPRYGKTLQFIVRVFEEGVVFETEHN